MKIATILLTSGLWFLTACAGAPMPAVSVVPAVQVVETKIAVPVPCVPFDFPPAPAFTDTSAALKAAPDEPARYDLLAANWEPKQKRLDALEAALAACR